MKLIKQFLSVSSFLITVASATLQHDADYFAGSMCPSHSQSIGYQNDDKHTLLPTSEVVTMITNHNWPSDAEFSIKLAAVSFMTRVDNRPFSTTIYQHDFNNNLWLSDYTSRNFEFSIYPGDKNIEKSVGHIVLKELPTKKYGVFFDILSVGVAKEYEGRGLASKSLRAVLKFCDQNPQLECQKLSILPGSDHDKIGLIYGRQGFWPYIRDESAEHLTPMSLTKTAEFFHDKDEYANWVISENAFAKFPIMIRYAGADTLPLRGIDTQPEILTKLKKIV